MAKVFITGVSGFVGVHLANALLDKGYEVVGVDNFFRGKWDADFSALAGRERFTFFDCDLTQFSAWEKIPGGPFDHVYHLAAVNGTKLFYDMPHEVLRINLMTTLNAVEWMHRYNPKGKLLFTSSNEAYAGSIESGNIPIPTPEDVPLIISDVRNPRWTYAGTKLIGEQLMINYGKHFGFRFVIARPHNFYGPRAGFNHVIPEFIERITKQTDPFPIYGPEHTRTFCYITDAVEAMILLMEAPHTDGSTYHIGAEPNEEITMRGLAEELFTTAGWKPGLISPQGAPAGSVIRRAGDISRIKSAVGWVPKTSIQSGLQKTFNWYKQIFK